MNKEVVEKRRAILINVLYLAFIVAVFYVVLKGFLGILLPFIAAFIVAALIQRPVKFLHKKTHIGRGPMSAVFVLLLLGVVGLLLFLLGNRIFVRVRGFYDYVMLRMQNVPELFADIPSSGVQDIVISSSSAPSSPGDEAFTFIQPAFFVAAIMASSLPENNRLDVVLYCS